MPRILEISTDQTGPFKTTFETLKDVLTDVNIECRSIFKKDTNSNSIGNSVSKEDSDIKPKNWGHMKIFAIDITKNALIDVKLDAASFNKFECNTKSKKINLGINLGNFHKIIKTIDKDEWLTLYVDDEERNNLNIKINNHDEQKDTIFKLKLLDLADNNEQIPDTNVDSHIIMGSQEFHKTCREMQGIADFVEFQCLPDAFIMKCKGEHLERTTRYKTTKNEQTGANVEIDFKKAGKNKYAPKIVEGVYDLKYLVSFTKFSTLSSYIELYMRNDYPLVIKYSISTLGRLFLCLVPKNFDNINDYNDDEQNYPEDM